MDLELPSVRLGQALERRLIAVPGSVQERPRIRQVADGYAHGGLLSSALEPGEMCWLLGRRIMGGRSGSTVVLLVETADRSETHRSRWHESVSRNDGKIEAPGRAAIFATLVGPWKGEFRQDAQD